MANNSGIWAVDSSGALQLIVRTGDILNGKTVTGLAFLARPQLRQRPEPQLFTRRPGKT